MSWASRRRTLYGGGVALFVLLVLGVPAFLWWYEAPTCFDGVRNQGETSADRGGPCALLDETQVQNARILWARSFEVIPGVYNAVAEVENPNFDAGISETPYSFKLFDAQNILIAERRGTAYLSPNTIIPVFEGGIDTGARVPTRTFFEFLEAPQWERVEDPISGLSVGTRELTGEDSAPRLSATIENDSFEDISDIEVVAVLFNAQDIAIAASRTAIQRLPQQSSQTVVFTWPKAFNDPVARIQVTPQSPFQK